MTVDFTQPVQSMPDGSYVVTLSNGWPYNVVQGDYSPVVDVAALWQSIQDWIASGNVATEYQPPDPLISVTTPAQRQMDAIMANLPQLLLSLATGTGSDPLSVALQQMIKGVT